MPDRQRIDPAWRRLRRAISHYQYKPSHPPTSPHIQTCLPRASRASSLSPAMASRSLPVRPPLPASSAPYISLTFRSRAQDRRRPGDALRDNPRRQLHGHQGPFANDRETRRFLPVKLGWAFRDLACIRRPNGKCFQSLSADRRRLRLFPVYHYNTAHWFGGLPEC